MENNDPPEAPLHKDRSLKEKRREDTPIVPTGTDPEGFAEFWQAYPKRDGDNPRKTAVRAYGKALRDGADPPALLRAARALAAEMQLRGKLGTELVPMAATWLNQGRFERFTDPAGAGTGKSPDPASFLAKLSEDDWRGHLRRWDSTKGHWPLAQRTPPPDDPKTKAPPHLLAEIGIRHSDGRPTLALLTGTG